MISPIKNVSFGSLVMFLFYFFSLRPVYYFTRINLTRCRINQVDKKEGDILWIYTVSSIQMQTSYTSPKTRVKRWKTPNLATLKRGRGWSDDSGGLQAFSEWPERFNTLPYFRCLSADLPASPGAWRSLEQCLLELGQKDQCIEHCTENDSLSPFLGQLEESSDEKKAITGAEFWYEITQKNCNMPRPRCRLCPLCQSPKCSLCPFLLKAQGAGSALFCPRCWCCPLFS